MRVNQLIRETADYLEPEDVKVEMELIKRAVACPIIDLAAVDEDEDRDPILSIMTVQMIDKSTGVKDSALIEIQYINHQWKVALTNGIDDSIKLRRVKDAIEVIRVVKNELNEYTTKYEVSP